MIKYLRMLAVSMFALSVLSLNAWAASSEKEGISLVNIEPSFLVASKDDKSKDGGSSDDKSSSDDSSSNDNESGDSKS